MSELDLAEITARQEGAIPGSAGIEPSPDRATRTNVTGPAGVPGSLLMII